MVAYPVCLLKRGLGDKACVKGFFGWVEWMMRKALACGAGALCGRGLEVFVWDSLLDRGVGVVAGLVFHEGDGLWGGVSFAPAGAGGPPGVGVGPGLDVGHPADGGVELGDVDGVSVAVGEGEIVVGFLGRGGGAAYFATMSFCSVFMQSRKNMPGMM